MHDEILENIVLNAFNGMGDCDGSDDFGYSFAWIDLMDFLEDYMFSPAKDSDELSAECMAYLGGTRYAMAYIDADGTRSAVGYTNKVDVKMAYLILEAAFMAFEERTEDEV